jgi:hypothetical protein
MNRDVKERRTAPLQTPTDLGTNARRDIAAALNKLLADMFALYLKTKNFHWHVSGPHFRDYHLLFDEQADQIFATTDEIAERVRKIGGNTLHSIGQIASDSHQRQRRGLRRSPRHACGAEIRQPGDHRRHARDPRSLRGRARCRHHKPDRGLDRSG